LKAYYNQLVITISLKKFIIIACLTLMIFLTLTLISACRASNLVKNVEALTPQTINSTIVSEKIQEGNLLMNKSKYEDAIKLYDQVLKIDPSSVEALNGNGLALNKLGRYQDAITWLDNALKIEPTSAKLLNNKGVSLANLDKFGEAITWFDKAIKIDPSFIDALYNKGGALAELGKYGEAAIWTNKALEIDKTHQNSSSSKNLLLPND
jgi:tetratricopeptide (TPR) repeat protein